MLSITKSNIDEILFDFVEGNLSAGDKSALEKFIDENPELRKDLDAWSASKVQEEQIVFPVEKALKKGSYKAILYSSFGLIIAIILALSIWPNNELGKVPTPVNITNQIPASKNERKTESQPVMEEEIVDKEKITLEEKPIHKQAEAQKYKADNGPIKEGEKEPLVDPVENEEQKASDIIIQPNIIDTVIKDVVRDKVPNDISPVDSILNTKQDSMLKNKKPKKGPRKKVKIIPIDNGL